MNNECCVSEIAINKDTVEDIPANKFSFHKFTNSSDLSATIPL